MGKDMIRWDNWRGKDGEGRGAEGPPHTVKKGFSYLTKLQETLQNTLLPTVEGLLHTLQV